MNEKEPIYHRNCWECPECHMSNSPPSRVLTSMPPQTPYYCSNCDYRYHWSPDYSPEHPIGKVIVPPKQSNRYENISDTANRYETISDVPEVTEPVTNDTENNSLPRTKTEES